AHGESALKIGSNNERHFSAALKLVDEHGSFIGASFVQKRTFRRHGEKNAPEMVAVNLVAQSKIVRAFQVHELAQQADHEHLADFFFQGKLLESFLRPAVTIVLKVDRPGMLKIVSSQRAAEQ